MTIAAGEKLKPGMMSPRVEALQMCLGIEVTGSFNALTKEAVLAFRNASGLDADGAVGRQQCALSTEADYRRWFKLKVNLERWRWLPNDRAASCACEHGHLEERVLGPV